MHVQMRNIDSIKPYENNPRSNDAAVDAVAKSTNSNGRSPRNPNVGEPATSPPRKQSAGR
jgi:hypothetical protein